MSTAKEKISRGQYLGSWMVTTAMINVMNHMTTAVLHSLTFT
jgi:hypothetical protein